MRIGLFTDTYFPQVSGVATSIRTLKDALEAQGHEVYIFTTTDPKIDKNTKEEHIYRFSSLPYFGFKDRRFTFRGLIQAVEISKQLQLDIIHTQTEFSLGLMGKYVARQMKIPVIHTYHTMYEDYTHYVARGMLLKPSAVGPLVKAYLKGMSGVIAPSELVKETLIRYGVENMPIPVIPTGVPVPKLTDHEADLRAKFGFKPDQPVILSLGRLAYEKNIAMTISAFSELLQSIPDARLVIAGDGPARKSLQEQVEDLDLQDKITFAGMVNHDEVYDYYHMANVFVSSSDSETQGLTFIEAMAADRPFVAIHSPYLDNLVDSKAIGTLVDDYDDFLEAIEYYLKHANTEADSEVRHEKMKNVDATHFGKRVFAFYEDVIAGYQQEQDASQDDEELNDDEIGYIKRILRNPFRRN
ncbi:glycosyltransferase family 4 protein [Eupransor demetentiae]|uniref:Glycosyltransferase involved in cell wall bisynthesis (RfaB) n=1 Tax=Eupransor demetentiae TaxID=3109584 RepID=A0ABM9N2Y2_9LACO|nr:Glycosyltransferase involved in cell wall bisynthesis (RfaB) [Lactobacillaceae bacterium LMG 33000]